MPIWEPSLLAAGFTTADVSTAIHTILARDARRELPPAPRPACRRHPDPAPADPERRVDRRPVPDARAGVLPVRERGPRAGGRRPARGETGLSPAMAGVASLDRPVVLGGQPGRLASPSRVAIPREEPVVGRAHPAAPVCPAGAQRVVLGALGGSADLDLRRPDQHRGARRDRVRRHRVVHGRGPRLRRRHPPEPVPLADRRDLRGPLGPQGGAGRQRHPASRPRPADPAGRDRQPAARLRR